MLFLKRQFHEAVDALKRVLAIDPEDLQAHYNLMLCYQGTRADTSWRRARKTLYQRFKADESSQAITGPYRQLHPDDNNERQQIHEHRRRAVAEATGGRRAAAQIDPSEQRPLASLLRGLVLSQASAPASARRSTFTDVTAAAGIRVRHTNGAFGKKYLPETMGSGVRVSGRDGDGWQDILLINVESWPGPAAGKRSMLALYRNNRQRHVHRHHARRRARRRDVRARRRRGGLRQRRPDATSTSPALGGNRLFRNRRRPVRRRHGARRASAIRAFRRAPRGSTTTATAGSTCSSRNYVQWSIEKDLFCTLDGKTKSYCTPESYKGQSPTLYRNRGDGTFENVTRSARGCTTRRRRRSASR